jgi:hypothetical protein
MDIPKKWAPDTPLDLIPTLWRARDALLLASQLFLDRAAHKCDIYLPEPDSDMRLSIFFNPISTKLCLR